jgi:penicillin-binding protein 2
MVDSRRRLRWLLAGFIVACAGVFGRLVAIELVRGDEYRAETARPTVKRRTIPAARGRILARDGTVLATDRPLISLALAYRYLQEPPDPHWLRAMARSRLVPRDRRRPERIAAEEARVRDERAELVRRLEELCGISRDVWQARCRRIQARVEELSERVNHRHQAGHSDGVEMSAGNSSHASDDSWLTASCHKLLNALFQANVDPPTEITIAEELQEHIVFEGLSLEAVAEIEGHPDEYPGTAVVRGTRRVYPAGSSAAHVLGYTNSTHKPEKMAGQVGVERQYDAWLCGQDGAALDEFDRHGRLVSSTIEREPRVGRDLVLTIDPRLQHSTEVLLDGALARRVSVADHQASETSGGAIIVMDVHSGAILAAASAPRFEPAAFAEHDGAAIERTLSDPAHPLFDRAIQMAIPPGSVFKTVTALALLDAPTFDPARPFDCQGYLNSPDGSRCMIYRRYGIGHGPVTLVDALAQSCNVYFFHHADWLGDVPIVDWGRRTGFGDRTGIDLPGEVAAHLPAAKPEPTGAANRQPRRRDAAESLAIGQGSLTATPIQIVRMMAAIANGGQLVTPHVAEGLGLASDPAASPDQAGAPAIDIAPPRSIPGLDPRKLEIVREGLRRVVADPKGTGHATVALEGIAVAGKTGTAEAGAGSPDHAWFAGYAPADSPRIAFVVVLEHAGDAAATAAPAAKRLVERLQEMGLVSTAHSGKL